MELNGTKSILLQEREVGPERMVMAQVSGESLGWAAKGGSLTSRRKEFKSEPS